jgi:hypothetical protein
MKMADHGSPMWRVASIHPPTPNRCLFKGAATPFIVHGHRHACLYRSSSWRHIPFIVLKICKKLWVPLAAKFAYLQNNEACGGGQDA